MDIRIHSQNAQIGIQQSLGQYEIQREQFPMELSVQEGKLYIEREDAQLYIDQSRCFSEAGLKSIRELSALYAKKGMKAALEGAARIAREGKEMADIHKGPAIARQAKARDRGREKQFNIDMVPKSQPDIKVIQGKIRGYYEKGKIDARLKEHRPYIKYHPSAVKIYLKQKNFINIEYVGKHLDVVGG